MTSKQEKEQETVGRSMQQKQERLSKVKGREQMMSVVKARQLEWTLLRFGVCKPCLGVPLQLAVCRSALRIPKAAPMSTIILAAQPRKARTMRMTAAVRMGPLTLLLPTQ